MHGWVAHHNSDIWALSNPVGNKGGGDPKWANWAQGANWLCQDLWEHYQFTMDKNFLKDTAYPLMKGAATFCLDWLVENKEGYLVVAPSVSPENVFKYGMEKKGMFPLQLRWICPSFGDLFSNLINASNVLGIDTDFRDLFNREAKKIISVTHRTKRKFAGMV